MIAQFFGIPLDLGFGGKASLYQIDSEPNRRPRVGRPTAMIISSRTPEGEPIRCPLCQADVVVEPSIVVEPSVLVGDATCPCCGHLLWFVQTGDTIRLFDSLRSHREKDRVLEIIADRLGVDRNRFTNDPYLVPDLDAESLELLELVMELEDELDWP